MSDLVDRPVEIEELDEAVETVHDYVHTSVGSKTTVSLVVRDMESREILGESTLYPRSGVYALTHVTDEPADPDAYGLNRPEPPEWVEWLPCDPPLEHLVNGVRCRDCGEQTTVLRGNPDAMAEHQWDQLLHDAHCPHADPENEQRWWDNVASDYVESRPAPWKMALDCIWREAEWLYAYREKDRSGTVTEAVERRLRQFQRELESRLKPRFPECQNCGQELDLEDRGWATCPRGCADQEVVDEYWRQQDRLWGKRGHGRRVTPRRTDARTTEGDR